MVLQFTKPSNNERMLSLCQICFYQMSLCFLLSFCKSAVIIEKAPLPLGVEERFAYTPPPKKNLCLGYTGLGWVGDQICFAHNSFSLIGHHHWPKMVVAGQLYYHIKHTHTSFFLEILQLSFLRPFM